MTLTPGTRLGLREIALPIGAGTTAEAGATRTSP